MSDFVNDVIRLQAINQELDDLKNGKKDKEIQAKANELFPESFRQELKDNLTAKLQAIFNL